MTTDPTAAGCTAPCIACMTDESHDPAPTPTETDEQRADREETERDHARGDHTHCGLTCETELPTEQLRNFVVAKGYPGTAGALDELLRRARNEAAATSAPADRAAVLRDAADTAYRIARRLDDQHHDERAQGAWDVENTLRAELRRLSDEAQQPEADRG